jgi:hypothetical protein
MHANDVFLNLTAARSTAYSALTRENLAHFENTHAICSLFHDLGHGFRLNENSKGTLSSPDEGSQEGNA